MNIEAPSVKKGRKHDQVIEGATRVFLRDGFEGASVDDIAREAQVSKATLYSYFADKRVLFMEVAQNECRRIAADTLDSIDMSAPPRDVLLTACKTMMRFFYSDFGLAMFRIAVAESTRFPELGRQFYCNGPLDGHEKIVFYLRHAVDKGDLVIGDIELAAFQLPQLCQAELHEKLLFGLQDSVSEDQIDRIANGAVDLFLARYGA
ncbi:TetR/AcrR family transcriptional regulator [Nereida sp. MMG025]|uniref:TetR/AcrR family transcriptional regulator n=1 Tax=Nereida sp. MMG025 TaxID=2909981 RepID=UPI001F1A8996|nr:TetR/AcrR family transcriptional regulator [Nereida sp. MMG025]MCF6444460.1 TetR/AcrR family transcriptional regulator [Nereida sp. MMG025]